MVGNMVGYTQDIVDNHGPSEAAWVMLCPGSQRRAASFTLWEDLSHLFVMLPGPVCFCFSSWLKNRVKYHFRFHTLPPILICSHSVSKLPLPLGVRRYSVPMTLGYFKQHWGWAVLDLPSCWSHHSCLLAQHSVRTRGLCSRAPDSMVMMAEGLEMLPFSKSRGKSNLKEVLPRRAGSTEQVCVLRKRNAGGRQDECGSHFRSVLSRLSTELLWLIFLGAVLGLHCCS